MNGEAITLDEGPSKGVYRLRGPGDSVAELSFSKAGTTMIIIDHTEVPEAFRGQGAGLKLVERAIADARASLKKIIPLCPFAKAQFAKHPEWDDVLKR